MKYTNEKINELLYRIKQDSPEKGIIYKMVYVYGRNVSSVLKLKVEDVDFENASITFIVRSRTVTLPLTEDIADELSEIIKNKSPNEFIFVEDSAEFHRYSNHLNNYLESFIHKLNRTVWFKQRNLITNELRILRGQHLFMDGADINTIHNLYQNGTVERTKDEIKYDELVKLKFPCNTLEKIFTDFTDTETFDDEFMVELTQEIDFDPAANEKYIKYYDGRYYILKTIQSEKRNLGSFDTLDEAIAARDEMIENNWGFDESTNVVGWRKEGKYGRHITYHNDAYRVIKSINGQQRIFGAFDNVEDARNLRDILVINNWDSTKIDAKLFRNITAKSDLDRHFYIRKERDKYIVSRVIDGELKYFGSYDTKEEAIAAREHLLVTNWETDDEIDEEKIDEYIYLINGEYIVKKEISGNEEIFGIFNDMSKAIEFRNLCVRNNWRS